MKFIKKINRGLILSLVVLLFIGIYYGYVGIISNQEKPKAVSVVENFIDCYSTNIVLNDDGKTALEQSEELKASISNYCTPSITELFSEDALNTLSLQEDKVFKMIDFSIYKINVKKFKYDIYTKTAKVQIIADVDIKTSHPTIVETGSEPIYKESNRKDTRWIEIKMELVDDEWKIAYIDNYLFSL